MTNWDKIPTSGWKGVSGSWADHERYEKHREEQSAEEERRRTAKENLASFNANVADWYSTCRTCGKTRRGTLKELSGPCECANANAS